MLKKDVLGVRGVGAILEVLSPNIKTVAIGVSLPYLIAVAAFLLNSRPAEGGIKQDNLIRTLHGCVAPNGKALNGVAVISEIVSSHDPFITAQNLSRSVRSFTARAQPQKIFAPWEIKGGTAGSMAITHRASHLIQHVRRLTPLVHQITNYVAMNQSANVTLALGGSPIMATAAKEMEDLGRVIGALLVNFGTIGDLEGMMVAGMRPCILLAACAETRIDHQEKRRIGTENPVCLSTTVSAKLDLLLACSSPKSCSIQWPLVLRSTESRPLAVRVPIPQSPSDALLMATKTCSIIGRPQ